ncbi:AAA family ATPase, partial [Klebsiella pneumoniae]
WCAYEAGKGLKARMRAYRRHHNLDIEPLPFAALTTPLDLWSDPANVDKLIGEINGIKHTYFRAMNVPLGMVVIDTHNAATPGASEIDSEAAGRIRAQYRRIVAETGGTVVIVGHSNDQGKHRGNQQLTNYIDTIINVTRKTLRADKDIIPARDDDGREVRVMTVKKQREGQDGEKHEFVLQTVEDGTRNKFGKARTSCVVKGANIEAVSEDEGRPQESAPGSIGAKVTKQEALFLTCMLEALDSDGIAPPLELKASNDVQLPGSVARVVDYDIVKRLMGNKMLREEDSSIEGQKRHRQRVKSALKRAREGLQHVGVVNGYGPLNLIWWTGKAVRGIRATQPRSAELFDDRNQPAAGEISEFF